MALDTAFITQRLTLYEKLLRLDQPIGIVLLLWPTLWGLWVAGSGYPDWETVWIFVLGTVLMRSAGCAINDFADRHLDPHVARTRDRPLAAGKLRPAEALVLAAVLALAAFLLILRFPRITLYLSVVALLLAATYPFAKRFIAIPQAYLGVAFGFGIPLAFAAQLGDVPWYAWLMVLANVFWAIAYDTEYAMVDRDDDRKLGIKTSAITFGHYDVTAVMVCYGLFLAAQASLAWYLSLGVLFYAALASAVALAAYQYRLIRGREPAKCFKAFLHNNWIGAVLFVGFFAAYRFGRYI